MEKEIIENSKRKLIQPLGCIDVLTSCTRYVSNPLRILNINAHTFTFYAFFN